MICKQFKKDLSVERKATPRIRTILLVDDNDDIRVLTKWFFDNVGYVVDTARSAEEALSRFDPKTHDLILTDNSMSGMSGAELAHVIKMRSPATLIVMFTGNPPQDKSCIDSLIPKPASLLDVKESMDKLLEEGGE
jgi:CheY-like chemotaxis protein